MRWFIFPLMQFSFLDPETWLEAMWKSVKEGLRQFWNWLILACWDPIKAQLNTWIEAYLPLPQGLVASAQGLWTSIGWVELVFPAKLCISLLTLWLASYGVVLVYRFIKSWLPTVA